MRITPVIDLDVIVEDCFGNTISDSDLSVDVSGDTITVTLDTLNTEPSVTNQNGEDISFEWNNGDVEINTDALCLKYGAQTDVMLLAQNLSLKEKVQLLSFLQANLLEQWVTSYEQD